MNYKALSLVSLALVIVGCTGISGNVVVEVGDAVSVDYTGFLSDGSVFDTSIGGEPLTFTTGQRMMLPDFEEAIIGMNIGEEKTFTLSPSQAYGERNSELIVELNKTIISEMIGEELFVGMQLYSDTGTATVIGIDEVNATLDLNHPLAGMELTFTVKLLSIN